MTDETSHPVTKTCIRQACDALTSYVDNLEPSGRRSVRSLLQQEAVMQGLKLR